jgi:hypothetical protein
MTEAQTKRLREYAKVKPGEHLQSLLVSIGGPWSRQINDALVKRGYLRRDDEMPGLCFITPAGLAALAEHEEKGK